MNSPPNPHPADQALIGFNLGRLDRAKAAQVADHLKNCSSCRRRLVRLSGEMEQPKALPKQSQSNSGFAALAAAAFEDASNPTAAVLKSRPRLLNPVSVSAAICLALLMLGIVWKIAASPKAAASVSAVGNRTLAVDAQSQQSPPPSKSGPQQPPPLSTSSAAPSPARDSTRKRSPQNDSPHAANPPALATLDLKPSPAKSSPAAFFNEKDLTGWLGPANVWHAEHGAIVGLFPAGQTQSTVLCSQRNYKDFDLKFQAIVDEGVGDCAVQIRSQMIDGDARRAIGPECAIYGKDPPKDRRTGSLVVEPQNKVEKKAPAKLVDRFVKPVQNHFHIRCQGKHILFEVNGIKTVNADFPGLPGEGVIAWKLDASRPPHKVTFTKIKFTDLSGVPPRNAPERPSLVEPDVLRAEIKFEAAIKKADENLLKHIDLEIKKLQHSRSQSDLELRAALEHEREQFKAKGLIPMSRPLRKSLTQYAKDLVAAQRAVGSAFDVAIDRAGKAQNAKRREDLIEEASKILAPRQVAIWQLNDDSQTHRMVLYSDATFVNDFYENQPNSQFWQGPLDDRIVLEFPDKQDPTAANARVFELSIDGKTLTGMKESGEKFTWQRVDE